MCVVAPHLVMRVSVLPLAVCTNASSGVSGLPDPSPNVHGELLRLCLESRLVYLNVESIFR